MFCTLNHTDNIPWSCTKSTGILGQTDNAKGIFFLNYKHDYIKNLSTPNAAILQKKYGIIITKHVYISHCYTFELIW